MKAPFIAMAVLLTWAIQPVAFAQLALQPQATISRGSGEVWNFEWESISGRTYFVQYSEDLQNWIYFPDIVAGDGTVISYGAASTSDKFFVRLRYTDEITSDPENDDFDGDGLSNIDELLHWGTDPLNAMTDGVTPDAVAVINLNPTWWNTTGYPQPTDAEPSPPVASVQNRRLEADLAIFTYYGGQHATVKTINVHKNISNLFNATYYDDDPVDPVYAEVVAAGDFADFSAAVSQLTFDGLEDGWICGVKACNTYNSDTPPVFPQIVTPPLSQHYYKSVRQQYRVVLSAAAPKGGYRIPIRIATPKRTLVSPGNWSTSAGSPQYIDLIMPVAEGQTQSDPVEVPIVVIPNDTQTIYLPADIQIYQQGFPPEIDGMCILPGNGFFVDFDGLYGDSKFDVWLPDATFEWQGSRVKLNGKFEQSTVLCHNGLPGHLPEQTVSVFNEGCYHLQLEITLPDSSQIDMPYTRRWNARSIVDSDFVAAASGRAGAPDYFGVANDSVAMDIRDRARAFLGSTQYRKAALIVTNPYPPGDMWNPNTINYPKCNIFVTHVSNCVGNWTPYWRRNMVFCAAPLAREDWFTDPSEHVDLNAHGWPYCGEERFPSPGMAVSTDHGGGVKDSGHVGILDYDGSWISAGKLTVNKFIFLDDPGSGYLPNHLRANQ